MRRFFIVEARAARAKGDFSIKNLPASSGRLDVVCRCMIAALKSVEGVRRDTAFLAVLEGDGSYLLKVEGWKLKKLPSSELGVAKILQRFFSGEEVEGLMLEHRGFREVIEDVARKAALFYLHEEGAPIWSAELPLRGDVAFVLGDHLGLPEENEKILEKLGATKLSLGPRKYLGSYCIAVVHYELDVKLTCFQKM